MRGFIRSASNALHFAVFKAPRHHLKAEIEPFFSVENGVFQCVLLVKFLHATVNTSVEVHVPELKGVLCWP